MPVSEKTAFEALRLYRHPEFRDICAEDGYVSELDIAREAASISCMCEDPKVSSPKDLYKGLKVILGLEGVENE